MAIWKAGFIIFSKTAVVRVMFISCKCFSDSEWLLYPELLHLISKISQFFIVDSKCVCQTWVCSHFNSYNYKCPLFRLFCFKWITTESIKLGEKSGSGCPRKLRELTKIASGCLMYSRGSVDEETELLVTPVLIRTMELKLSWINIITWQI